MRSSKTSLVFVGELLGRDTSKVIRSSSDPWLLTALAVSAALGVYQLGWGLPHGNDSWAADALGPLTVLSITRHSVASWNSGWFYFKYPLGYPLLLLTSYLPYLSVLVLTGYLRHPTASYPYGFSDVEAAFYTMTLIGRVVSVALEVGIVALTYGIGRRLLGRTAGALAAWFVATAYPLVYYAHTTNLDAAYLFWLTLAVWATVVATENERRWPYVLLGIGAAMAVSTKEQSFALLLPLPVILAVYAQRDSAGTLSRSRRWWTAVWNPRTRAGLAAAMLTLLIANNAVINPRGMVNRFLNLTGHELPGVTARLTPLKFSVFKGAPKEWQYMRQLGDTLESSFGLPLLVVAVAGAVYVARSRPRAAFCVLLPAGAYYFLSLRTHDLITLRYTLPLIVLGSLCASAACVAAVARWPRPAGLAVGILCLLSLARAIELDLLLRNDSRYAAEEWMREHIPGGSTIETYQKPVYLPRFAGYRQRTVTLAERSIDGVTQRRPEFIVISSAAKKGITHRWNPDWRRGHTLLVEVPQARAFMGALEAGQLPYRQVAGFKQQSALLRVRITSLCPEISIFQRVLQ